MRGRSRPFPILAKPGPMAPPTTRATGSTAASRARRSIACCGAILSDFGLPAADETEPSTASSTVMCWNARFRRGQALEPLAAGLRLRRDDERRTAVSSAAAAARMARVLSPRRSRCLIGKAAPYRAAPGPGKQNCRIELRLGFSRCASSDYRSAAAQFCLDGWPERRAARDRAWRPRSSPASAEGAAPRGSAPAGDLGRAERPSTSNCRRDRHGARARRRRGASPVDDQRKGCSA